MKKIFKKIIILFITTTAYTYSMADVSGKMVAYTCYSCHGEQLTNLKSTQPLSTISLRNTLLAFKYDAKSASMMNRIAKGFTDNELMAVATYITGSH